MTKQQTKCPIRKMLANPPVIYGFIIGTCLIAVGLAIASEIFLGLEPCVMCIYQRWGFVVAALFAMIGLAFYKKTPLTAPLFTALSGLAFLGNGAVALYHSGVEQKWWVSAVEGCAVPGFDNNSSQSWLENIMSAPSKPCDEIAWQDPIIGLSMANYNVILCFGMFVVCIAASFYISKKQKSA